MEWFNIDLIVVICIAFSLILFTISGLIKKMAFKKIFETRINQVFFTIMKITFINALLWFGENMINGFKESRKMEGYTKLDYVASAFLLLASFLLISKIVLALPLIIFNKKGVI